MSFQTVPDDSITCRTETVGRVHPHVRAKIVDEDDQTVTIGGPGEICVAGYNVQKGYWADEKRSKEVMRKHKGDPETVWMHTGDVGVMDAEGYLRGKPISASTCSIA